ncbi:MAG: MFS transporter [Gemmatimonadetes bacterium]|nr:MFS transporter [Gemmatimonadota bacterium]
MTESRPAPGWRRVAAPVLLAGLGYFVDIFDLLLFSVVRVPSLADLGAGARALEIGTMLLNVQLLGMMVGGVAWGMLGDRRGRLSVLFGSIFLYSAASMANAFVTSVPQYAVLRFVAGVGLAGELGAGLTLVVELLPPATRGAAAAIVATMGVSGAVVAAVAGELMSWRNCMVLGGLMGFALFALRLNVRESPLFDALRRAAGERGNILRLFDDRHRFTRYLRSVLIGVPVWFTVGILITLAPELARLLGVEGAVSAGRAVFWFYLLTTVGDFASGMLSQYWKSRRRAAALFMAITAAGSALYLLGLVRTAAGFYAICGLLGLGTGYWAVTVTMAVEQFGTDLRATVGTSVPTFIRATAVPMLLAFLALRNVAGVLGAAAIVGVAAFGAAAWALATQPETYGRSLEYTEVPPPEVAA